MTIWQRALPWLAAGLVAVVTSGSNLRNQNQGEFNLAEFGRLPVWEGGRAKPFAALARQDLTLISNRSEFEDEKGKMRPAVQWLLAVLTGKANGLKVFRIENDQLLADLGLPRREGLRYSLDEFGEKLAGLQPKLDKARELDPKKLDLYQTKLLEFVNHINTFQELSQLRLLERILKDEELRLLKMPEQLRLLPPSAAGEEWRRWVPEVVRSIFLRDQPNASDDDGAKILGELLLAYSKGEAAPFNAAVKSYGAYLDAKLPPEVVKRAALESAFQYLEPFYCGLELYIFAFVFVLISWPITDPGTRSFLQRLGWSLTALTLILHTSALLVRMYLHGQPPVTNLYSSAVFIGWGAVILGLVLERFTRHGLGTVTAAVLGTLTLFIANYLEKGGDTLSQLEAVLDTNFWLATHVVCVTLGYTATYVAGLLGVIYVLWGVFFPRSEADGKALYQATYGIVCFAALLSFVGTVLGGIWADQSWGRFWGWDPKENGAILIVIWNVLILHARWSGLFRDRGVAVAAIFGNVVTTWSWFGTNQLGVGLHAYGFSNALATGCAIAWGVNGVLIAIGLLPTKFWVSHQRRPVTKEKARRKPEHASSS